MQWHNHSYIPADKHALFGASNYHWLNYDTDKIIECAKDMGAKERGVRLHAFAEEAINYRVPLSGRGTLAMYVNDCIKFGMDTEVRLLYSKYFFGTADAITIDRGKLRISDLKTGTKITPSMNQLLIYDALYCHDYGVNPNDIEHELRIYFKDDKITLKPKAHDIIPIMDKMVEFNKALEEREGEWR